MPLPACAEVQPNELTSLKPVNPLAFNPSSVPLKKAKLVK